MSLPHIVKSTVLLILLVLLTVRPFFVRLPSDVTSVTGREATLRCRVGGSPRPHVLWRRHDGRMPVGRARLDDDSSLRIKDVTVDDAGVYICQAENAVATVVANATLTVYGASTCLTWPHYLVYCLIEYVIISSTDIFFSAD